MVASLGVCFLLINTVVKTILTKKRMQRPLKSNTGKYEVLEQSTEVFRCNKGIQNFDCIHESVTAKKQNVPLKKITIVDNNMFG